MEPVDPGVDWKLEGKKWAWAAYKFDLDCEDLFTTVHRHHNTVEIPLQDFYGFYHDVRELADEAATREELDHLLTQRKEDRTKELLKAFRKTGLQHVGDPGLIDDTNTWARTVLMFRTRSLAAFVMFFAGFIPNSEYKEDIKGAKSTSLQSRAPRDPNREAPKSVDMPRSLQETKAVHGEDSDPPCDFMKPVNPAVDWKLDKSWRWTAWKFDLELEDLFTTLHYQHNTVVIPLQDFYGFYHDVRELADEANTREELDRFLTERKGTRVKELVNAFERSGCQLAKRPDLFGNDSAWSRCVTMFHTRSLASFIMFFAGYNPDSEYTEKGTKDSERVSSKARSPSRPSEEQPDSCDASQSSQDTKIAEQEAAQETTPNTSPNSEKTQDDRPSKRKRTARNAKEMDAPRAKRQRAKLSPQPPVSEPTTKANTGRLESSPRSSRKSKISDSAPSDPDPPLKYRLRKRKPKRT